MDGLRIAADMMITIIKCMLYVLFVRSFPMLPTLPTNLPNQLNQDPVSFIHCFTFFLSFFVFYKPESLSRSSILFFFFSKKRV